LEDWRQKVTDDARGRAAQRREALAFIGQAFDSLVTGYTMGLARVERVLPAFDVEPIQALGQRFDPEAMEVLETVGDSGRAAGDVVEEVRRGYRWRGQVLRFALVRVAR
jgi:molecular chaperone GrpE